MNRLGWSILLLLVLAGAAFALMLQPASGPQPGGPSEASAPTARIFVPPSSNRSGLIVPVAGVAPAQLVDTWGQSRAGGLREHHAIDIMAPRGTPVLAARGGRVEKLFESGAGGHTIYVRSADGGYVDYYAHLDAYRTGLAEGQLVRQGEAIATVGSTGNASPDGPHLHFEVKRMGAGDKWYGGEPLNPYPLLAEAPAGG
ncbi:M23 family metallopeptidase [Sphingomonas sp. ac-8]|uniref:M23 family metallopeptidase n=1 Tax=Sphingomonas sp. ac-8 TaxID=3242977 RepID=UPI003A7F7C8E